MKNNEKTLLFATRGFPTLFFIITFPAKTACCLNPIVYAVSHPKFREAMARELPCFGIGSKAKEVDNKTMADSVKTESC